MDRKYINKKIEFTAKLIAFLEIKDLPEPLYPYVKMMKIKEEKDLQTSDYVIIVRIIETVDSYHAIYIDSNTNLEVIENNLLENLGNVILDHESKKIISNLLYKYKRSIKPRFLKHLKYTDGKYKYRH